MKLHQLLLILAGACSSTCTCCWAFSASPPNGAAAASSSTTTKTAPNTSSSQRQRVFVSTPVSKYPKRLVKDCMTPTDPSLLVLTPEMSVDESIALLLSRGLSGAPVVDNIETKRLVGMVSSFDFLQKEAFEGALLPMEGSIQHVEMYVEAAQRICGQLVSDVMTRTTDHHGHVDDGLTTIAPETTMREAAAVMTEKRLHRLPVVQKENGKLKLMGILSSSDVMQDLLHIVRNLPPAETTTDEDDGDDNNTGEENHDPLSP